MTYMGLAIDIYSSWEDVDPSLLLSLGPGPVLTFVPCMIPLCKLRPFDLMATDLVPSLLWYSFLAYPVALYIEAGSFSDYRLVASVSDAADAFVECYYADTSKLFLCFF